MFQEIRPGAGFKTGDLVKEKLGGLHGKTNPDILLRSREPLRWSFARLLWERGGVL